MRLRTLLSSSWVEGKQHYSLHHRHHLHCLLCSWAVFSSWLPLVSLQPWWTMKRLPCQAWQPSFLQPGLSECRRRSRRSPWLLVLVVCQLY